MAIDHVLTNIRDAEISTGMAKDVQDTQQLSGLASDSLSGKNSTSQYESSGGCSGDGPWGGLNKGN